MNSDEVKRPLECAPMLDLKLWYARSGAQAQLTFKPEEVVVLHGDLRMRTEERQRSGQG